MEGKYREIETQGELALETEGRDVLCHLAFQGVDLTGLKGIRAFEDCLFLGCELLPEMYLKMDDDCVVLPEFTDNDYKIFRGTLYDAQSLYSGYDPDKPSSFEHCYDTIVYKTFVKRGFTPRDVKVCLSRHVHDFSIDDALQDFLTLYDERDIVAVMGGHAMSRCDESYRKVVEISKILTEKGKIMVSGGGPGAMEATHLGAWMAGRSREEVDEAIAMMSVAPTFRDTEWLASAFRVMERFPQTKYCSLSIPTWFYGHEPSTPLATHIAKYFHNSIREDEILSVAKGGVIYSPGSAGTLQEIFQDAAQNHYESFGYPSPMVFLDSRYYTEDVPVYPFLKDMMERGRYRNLLLFLADEVEDVVTTIMDFK